MGPGHVGAIFRSWALPQRFLGAVINFLGFFIDFEWILGRFGEGFGGFGEGFNRMFRLFFRIFIENHDFVKNSVLPGKNQYFSGFKLFQIIKKSNKNQCKC